MNIYDATNSFTYVYRDVNTSKLNIGFKSPNGEDKLTYITSCESPEFWERYSKGMLERSILFVGSDAKAKAAEWFAMDQGFKLGLQFFNSKNNAHKVDESILTTEDKQVIIDYLRGMGNGIQFGSADSAKADQNRDIVITIGDRIEKRTGYYKEILVPTTEVYNYKRLQVREELVNHTTVSKIKQRLLENPKLARETFLPIAVVVSKDGKKTVVNGNTRLEAACKTPGWNEVPVVYINETEFGSDKEIRERTYTQFGLYMNRESFEIRVHNSKGDLKRNVINFLASEKIDLSKAAHIDRARQLVYMNFDYACGSKQQLNGILTSILSDFEKNQAELTYQDNLITYDDRFFVNYSWDTYRSKDISVVHVTVGEAANAKPIGYICRVMKREKTKKGAIILHYTSKQEIASEQNNQWVQDLNDTIKYMELDIIVNVLPAFKAK